MKKGVIVVCVALSMTLIVSAFAYKAISANMKSQDITYEGHTVNQEVIVYNNVTDDEGNLFIGKNKAKLIALQHAGVQKNEFTIVELRLNRDDNKIVYEVEFFTESKEYDYKIDAITGEIVSYDFDIEGFENNFIGQEKAEQIALNQAQLTKQQVEYIENELDADEDEDEYEGRWKYQIEFRYGNKEYEYDIDAQTGEIIDYSVDND